MYVSLQKLGKRNHFEEHIVQMGGSTTIYVKKNTWVPLAKCQGKIFLKYSPIWPYNGDMVVYII